jgi:phage-related protein
VASNVEDLIIRIQADTANSATSIKALTEHLQSLDDNFKKVVGATEGTQKALTGFGAAMVAVNATLATAQQAWTLLQDTFGTSIREFKQATDEVTRLGNTLRILGDRDVKKSVAELDAFADAMENTTTVSGGQVHALVNVAKAAGLSNEATKKLIKTSADLAATGKTDVQGAFNAMLKSLKGSTLALSIMDPKLSNMSKEAAKSGAAIDYFAASLGGLAEEELKTFAGQAKLTEHRLDKMQENIGAVIAGILGMKPGVSVMNEILASFNKYLEENRERFIGYGKVVVEALKSVGEAVMRVKDFIVNIDFTMLLTNLSLLGAAIGTTFLMFNTGIIVSGIANMVSAVVMLGSAVAKGTVYVALNTGAWIKNSVAMAATAAQAALVTAGVATTIIAIDLFIKNVGNIPRLVESMIQAVVTGLGVVAEAIADVFGLDSVKKKIEGFTNYSAEQFAKSAEGLNAGLAGNAMDQIDNLKKAWGAATGSMKAPEVSAAAPSGTDRKKPPLPTFASPEALKALDELRAKNAQIDFEIRAANMFQRDIIKEKYNLEIESLKTKYKDVDLTMAGKLALEDQIKLLERKAELEASKAPTKEFEAAAKPGNDLAKQIGGAFTGGMEGMAGMVTGMMSGAGAVMDAVSGVLSFIQKLIDFIPQILNAVANIFSTLADLPLKILEGVQNVFKGAVKFVTDFIPNVLKAVPEIIYTIFKGLFIELPKAFMGLMKMLPGLILGIIKDLPSMVSEIVEAMISYMPEMAVTFIKTIVANAPKVVFALMRLFYVEIPKAIIRGIINGIQKIGDALGSLFKGGPKVEIDTKQATEAMKKAARALTGEAGKLFKVMDLTDGPVGQKSESLMQAVEEAGEKAKNWMMEAWKYILDGLNKVVGFFREMWQRVLDTLQGLWTALKNIWDGVIGAVRALWDAIKSIFNSYVSAMRGIVGALQNILAQLAESGRKIWEGFQALAGQAGGFFNNMGASIWDGLKSGLDSAWGIFAGFGNQIWSSLQGGLGSIGSVITNALNAINPIAILSRVFNMGDGGGRGTVEKTLGLDVPYANFAQGGIVPGNAVMPGDNIANDRILAMLSPDEAVIPRSKMSNPKIREVVQAILDGSFMPPRFANGYIDKITGGGGGWGNPFGGLGEAAGAVWNSIAGAAQGALGPIGGVISRTLNLDQIKLLGDAINSGALPSQLGKLAAGDIVGAAHSTFKQAMDIRDAAAAYQAKIESMGKTAYQTGRQVVDTVTDPKKAMWDAVRAMGRKALEKAVGANTPLMHSGGLVPGSGDVPITAQSDEFIMRRPAVKSLGLGNLAEMNRTGQLPNQGGGTQNFEVNININSSGQVDEKFIRNTMLPMLKDELRRASLDGQRVVFKSGVRG